MRLARLIVLTLSALTTINSAKACPAKSFAHGTLESIPAGLTPQCGIFYRLLRNSNISAGQDDKNQWIEVYSSSKPINLDVLEKSFVKLGYESYSRRPEAKKAIAESSQEYKNILGQDALTSARVVVSKDHSKTILLLQVTVPNDNMLVVTSQPNE